MSEDETYKIYSHNCDCGAKWPDVQFRGLAYGVPSFEVSQLTWIYYCGKCTKSWKDCFKYCNGNTQEVWRER